LLLALVAVVRSAKLGLSGDGLDVCVVSAWFVSVSRVLVALFFVVGGDGNFLAVGRRLQEEGCRIVVPVTVPVLGGRGLWYDIVEGIYSG